MSLTCIMVAPNGARRTKADHPALPLTPEDLAQTAKACFQAGAGAIHLHVRDADGRHSLDPVAYRAAMVAVRQACPDIARQVTTEAAGLFDLETQIAAVRELRPAAISFSIAELMREGTAKGEAFLAWAAGERISTQFILYDAEQISLFAGLWRSGRLHLSAAPRLILVAGRYAADQNSDFADFEALYAALRAEGLHEQSVWMTCAFGRGEMACLARTIELGGHVRVGFENAIVDAEGRPARDNAERVALAADLVRRHGRRVATGAEAADILGILRPDPALAPKA
ncbi:BKACE family enzyme [Xinfangfangia pollutisoli]|uniref:3-keto-5-aminohexanoate cleavage protein n=1 Tax=Xinfangfangia pollutisoli TaxID=2865960 RepID=UPI001CD7B4CB|nr:3-keto-5-aminohexanoate cleavage protein [Xinfangfangia pollutisoli]